MQDNDLTEEEIVQLPIDIHANKLVDWLIDRRHCVLKCQDSIRAIRKKINNAIQDMPAVESVTKLLKGTYINYFHCLKIMDILKETEADSKNIFGRYSSQRMKDWQEIIQLYEVDNIYLMEAANIFLRIMHYEIPALKKRTTKCQQTQSDCARKEVDYKASAVGSREKFQYECREMGISGKNVKRELAELVTELPEHYQVCVDKTAELGRACSYYTAFTDYINNARSGRLIETNCPLLAHMNTHGNTTVYQWKTGKVPARVITEEIDTTDDTPNEDTEEIDWGDDDKNEIDFSAITVEASGDIDFSEQIDFDIEINETGSGGVCEIKETVVPTAQGELAEGTDALTLLDYSQTRSQFISELTELEMFLRQRLQEMRNDSNILLIDLLSSAPGIVQEQTIETIEKCLPLIRDIVAQITAVRLQHLFMLKSSSRYVDRLTENLKKHLTQADKLEATARALVTRAVDAKTEQDNIQPEIMILLKKAIDLQRLIEDEISKKYNNRPVNIMGGAVVF